MELCLNLCYVDMCAYVYTHVHTRTHTCTHACTHTCEHTYTRTHTCAHTYTHNIHVHTHVYMHLQDFIDLIILKICDPNSVNVLFALPHAPSLPHALSLPHAPSLPHPLPVLQRLTPTYGPCSREVCLLAQFAARRSTTPLPLVLKAEQVLGSPPYLLPFTCFMESKRRNHILDAYLTISACVCVCVCVFMDVCMYSCMYAHVCMCACGVCICLFHCRCLCHCRCTH